MLKFIRRILLFLGLISEEEPPPVPEPTPPTIDPEESGDIAQDGADAGSEEDAPVTITDEEDLSILEGEKPEVPEIKPKSEEDKKDVFPKGRHRSSAPFFMVT
jgi:hypothetical protein